MKRVAGSLCVLILCLAASGAGGCASATPESSRQKLPAQFPAHVQKWHGGRVTEVEFVEDFRLPPGGRVQIAALDTAATPLPPADDNTREPAEKARDRFSETFAEGVRKTTKTYVPVDAVPGAAATAGAAAPRWATPAPKADALLVRGRVLELNPGSRAARYWVGFGAGASRVAVEGELVDAKTSRTVARFRHARGTGTSGGFGGDYDKVLRQDILTLGGDLGVLLLAYAPPSK